MTIEKVKLPLIVAHRGASAFAPENTLAAFRQAVDVHSDGIEFDVQLAKDGVPIVFHDFTLYRMWRRKIRTSKLTAAELKKIDPGVWFNAKYPPKADEKFAGATIPTLAEVFEFLKDFKGRIYVELKCRTDEVSALVEAVAGEIRASALLPQTVVKSFTLEAVRETKNLLPEIRAAALFAPQLTNFLQRRESLIERAKLFSADELSLHYSLAKPKMLEKAAREKMLITIWTADSPVWVKRARDAGIYAIITNDPARLLEEKQKIFNAETQRPRDF